MKLSYADVIPSRLKFNSHLNHNPEYDILELKISLDAFITYCKNLKTGEESMEYYAGENFVLGSTLKSNSRHYRYDIIPTKYRAVWNGLKLYYSEKLAA